jgi:hypothetical protein
MDTTWWLGCTSRQCGTLEPHLEEIKQQGHPQPLVHRKLLHSNLHWESRWTDATISHWLQTYLGDIGRPNRWAPSITQNSPSHAWDKPAYPPGQTDHPTKNKKWTINNELKTSTQQRGQKQWKCTGEGRRDKELISGQSISKKMSGMAGRLTASGW